MSDRLDYYFRQAVTEAELDLGFALLEQADRNLASDIGIAGIIDGMVATERAGLADLSVDLTAPGRAYDQLGRRIFYGTVQNVDLSTDLNGVSTAVQSAGNEKIVSLYVQFERRLSDVRTDGNSQQVFFRRDESFRFVVRQGAEAPAGQAAPPPLQPDALLVVDVTRRFGQSQISSADLSPNPLVSGDVGRRQRFLFTDASAIRVFRGDFAVLAPARDELQSVLQEVDDELGAHFGAAARRHADADIDAAALAGAPHALPAGTVRAHIEALLGHINAHANATAGAHPAAAIAYPGTGAWADGTANPAASVQGQLDKVVSDLGGASGAAKLGADALAGSPYALDAGTVAGQLAALLAHVNAHAGAASAAHPAAAIDYAGGPVWFDGRANPATTVQAQLDKIVRDLVGQNLGDDGAGRIGSSPVAGTPHSLTSGSVRAQLGALLALMNTAGFLAQANVWTAKQTLLGTDPGIEAALAVDAQATERRLALELRGSSHRMRLYYAAAHLELTLNARWNGAAWEKDNAGSQAARVVLAPSELRFQQVSASVTPPFADADWDALGRQFMLDATRLEFGTIVTSGQERVASAGPLLGYSGVQGEWGSANSSIGAGASFASGCLPAAPSSVTFTVQYQRNTDGTPTVFQAHRCGIAWTDGTSGTLPGERYMFLVFSAQ